MVVLKVNAASLSHLRAGVPGDLGGVEHIVVPRRGAGERADVAVTSCVLHLVRIGCLLNLPQGDAGRDNAEALLRQAAPEERTLLYRRAYHPPYNPPLK